MKEPYCDNGCSYRRHMVDINDSSYMIYFCELTLDAIADEVRCPYYSKREVSAD